MTDGTTWNQRLQILSRAMDSIVFDLGDATPDQLATARVKLEQIERDLLSDPEVQRLLSSDRAREMGLLDDVVEIRVINPLQRIQDAGS